MALSPVTEDQLSPESGGCRVVASKIFVSTLRVDAYVGIYAHERGRSQPLVIDVELDAAVAGAELLSDTVNYELVAEAARSLAASGHIGLVETFAEMLARACLADPRVTRARVRVDKPQALAPHAASAGVEVVLVRT
ncbi:dihydroneopterin aldolase [Phenylobacterium sp.]|uniref:dihydroneopterin aldolase n=1 Tax=Phenylobacterium sp. TaxID=1871053 RepID=UPI0027319B32|nr:dihydroneopterin aldolase [Phenylobacterium sp.]MDP1875001.1 dihydroneopterin aldolase [Phenylobacterium sp.]MDP3489472.1 dihydroneopterin aldolase [Phenylobacterium sp.]